MILSDVINNYCKHRNRDYYEYIRNIPDRLLGKKCKLTEDGELTTTINIRKYCVFFNELKMSNYIMLNKQVNYINPDGTLIKLKAEPFTLQARYYVVYNEILNTRYNRLKYNLQCSSNEFISIG
jgi:hypothetical protein